MNIPWELQHIVGLQALPPLHPITAEYYEEGDRGIDANVRTGRPVGIADDTTYHNDDGHAQAFVGTQGIRTMTNNERNEFRDARRGYRGDDFCFYRYGNYHGYGGPRFD